MNTTSESTQIVPVSFKNSTVLVDIINQVANTDTLLKKFGIDNQLSTFDQILFQLALSLNKQLFNILFKFGHVSE